MSLKLLEEEEEGRLGQVLDTSNVPCIHTKTSNMD